MTDQAHPTAAESDGGAGGKESNGRKPEAESGAAVAGAAHGSVKCQDKLFDPPPEQEKCRHEKWRKMNPQPRHCLECGLQMWDAGD